MSFFVFDSGAKVVFDALHKNITTDRGTDLEIGLFTNTGTDADIKALALADLTEPTGGGYARKTLTDASWDNTTPRVSSYAKQTFTATGGAMTGTIRGWFICTKGTTKRALYGGRFEDVPDGIVLSEGNSVSYTPSNSFS